MIERKRIKNRRNNAAGWVEDNPILLSGEFGIELDSTPMKMKIGDGMTPWNDLPYAGVSESEIIEIIEETAYTKQQIDTALNDKADADTVYTKQQIDTALNGKADKTNVYTKQEVDTIKQTIENEIPTKTSDLTNDSWFITISDVPAQVNADWNSNSGVSQILNKPTIPTKTSDLTNDSGFVDSTDLSTVAQTGNYNDLNNRPSLFSGDYNDLANKPVIPTVGDGTITIKQGNVTKGSFTTNQSGNTTITIDEGGQFTQQQADWNQELSTAVDFIKNKPTIPAAQVNADWNSNSGVSQILNKPTIPTKTSDLTNDSGFTTFSGDYNDLTNKPVIPTVGDANIDVNVNNTRIARFTTNQSTNGSIDLTIPTKTSDLTNDSGFITINDVPAQTQSDWNQSDSRAVDFIKNKPTIPTVGDGALTIQKNGTTVATFTANSNTNQTANITVPTDETDLGLSSETWTFTLSDNTTVSKEVILK